MGHVKPGGAADQALIAGAWPLWRRLTTYFPTWSLWTSSLNTPGAWGYFGNDFISGFRRNRSTRQAFELLDGTPDVEFDALSALASLNARRQEQMLRAVVIAYLTLPLSIVAVVAEVAGGSLVAFVREETRYAVQIALTATAAPLIFFMSHWRARQMVAVLDLIRIERGQSLYTTLELRGD